MPVVRPLAQWLDWTARQSRASHPAAKPQLCLISEADFYQQWPVVHAPDGGIAQDFHSPDLF